MGSDHTEARPEPLRGYRVLSDQEKALVDRIKLMEEDVAKLWAEVDAAVEDHRAVRYSLRAEGLFRDAFMNLVRTVTRPRDAYREARDEIGGENYRG